VSRPQHSQHPRVPQWPAAAERVGDLAPRLSKHRNWRSTCLI